MKLTLKQLDECFAIHSLSQNSQIPEQVFSAPLYFIAKTYDEVSIVLPQNIEIKSDEVEKDWQALEVVGPLDFSLTGILSSIATVLANEKISIFAISTFDTDYVLVKKNTLAAAIEALRANHYQVI
ncbi:MAG: ACT domain-containing protein [Colwellia sp.]|nr:ACT domain-containing protein [Colwellia sp.]MCW8864935.1 ACT domain-containing protein [Colwellia sp.]MCW9082139.1 ACT domain-containing protein [Colwellia sp.]